MLGPHERNIKDVSNSEELIDVLHHALILWSSSKPEEMIQCLSKNRIGANELIWNIAKQISNISPADSQERQWLEGWLADRDAIQREVTKIMQEPEQELSLLL